MLFRSIFSGIKNGIFIEIISVFGFAVNLLITKIYTPHVLNFLKRSDASFENNYVITYIITFITVYLVVSMILIFVRKAFKGLKKGFFNKMMGGVAGFIKALIVSLVIILVYFGGRGQTRVDQHHHLGGLGPRRQQRDGREIGRASCRERV